MIDLKLSAKLLSKCKDYLDILLMGMYMLEYKTEFGTFNQDEKRLRHYQIYNLLLNLNVLLKKYQRHLTKGSKVVLTVPKDTSGSFLVEGAGAPPPSN